MTMTDPPLLGVFLSKIMQGKRAQHWHWSQDVYPEVAIAVVGNPVIRTGLSVLKPWRDRAWRRASGIVSIGDDMANLIGQRIGSATKTKIVPNWAPAAPADDNSTGFRE